MNALKRFSGTHKQRNDKQLISLALEHFLLASALTLHEDFRFGKDRIERYVNSMLPRMDAIIDRYGDDCFLAALKAKCKDFDMEIVWE